MRKTYRVTIFFWLWIRGAKRMKWW